MPSTTTWLASANRIPIGHLFLVFVPPLAAFVLSAHAGYGDMGDRNVVAGARECNWLPKRSCGGFCGSSRRNVWESHKAVPQLLEGKSGIVLLPSLRRSAMPHGVP